MASSRLEKIGTIYTRTKGLLESGALKWVDRPLWYDVYEAFPPKEEPRFDRPKPSIPLRQIFYEEDKIRAMFHKNNKSVGTVNLQSKSKSLTQHFIDTYKKLEIQYGGSVPEEQIYQEASEMLRKDFRKEDSEFVSLSSAFKEADAFHKTSEKPDINVKDIFKD